MSAALTLRDVSFSHPGAGRPTLDAVDLEVAHGEMVAVLGPSGSGKTTLLRIAAGLEQPQTGAVLLDGTDVQGVGPEGRDVTMMFQKPHLFPHLDVRDNVAFADRLDGVSRREARAAAQRYLDLVHLDGLERRRPRELSGGQEQRVALARALAAHRAVMLLDEPFSSLDTDLRRQMHDLLAEVRAALEPTVVMVTHDLDEAGLADKVAVLVGGRIDQVGPVADLYTRPATVAVARLVGGFNELPGEIVDRRHHGPLGPTLLHPACDVTGTAIALVRREHLHLSVEPSPGHRRPSGRPDPGTTGAAGATGSDRTSGVGGAGARGRVVGVRHSGPRLLATVELERVMTRVQVETVAGQLASVGQHVRVTVTHAHAGAWAVPVTDPPGTPVAPAPQPAPGAR